MGTLGKLDGNRQAATLVTCSQYFDFVMLTTVTVFYEDQWEENTPLMYWEAGLEMAV